LGKTVAAIRHKAFKLGLRAKKRICKVDFFTINRMRNLREQGLSYPQIARRLGLGTSTVQYYINENLKSYRYKGGLD